MSIEWVSNHGVHEWQRIWIFLYQIIFCAFLWQWLSSFQPCPVRSHASKLTVFWAFFVKLNHVNASLRTENCAKYEILLNEWVIKKWHVRCSANPAVPIPCWLKSGKESFLLFRGLETLAGETTLHPFDNRSVLLRLFSFTLEHLPRGHGL